MKKFFIGVESCAEQLSNLSNEEKTIFSDHSRTKGKSKKKKKVQKSQEKANSRKKILSDFSSMYSEAKTGVNKVDIQISKPEVGDSSTRETFYDRRSPLARGILAEFNGDIYPKRPMGLHCWEARELPDCEAHRKGSKVRNEGKRVRNSSNRRTLLAEKQSDEEGSILRICGQVDAGGKEYRRIRRTISRYGGQQLAKASKVQEISCTKEKKISSKRARKVGNFEYSISRPGFSYFGDLDEQQPWHLDSPPLQDETTMAVGMFQPWEDFIGNETEEVFSDLYGSDGHEDSG